MSGHERETRQEKKSIAEPIHFPGADPTNPYQPPDPTRSEPVEVPDIDMPPPDYEGTAPHSE